VGEGEGAEVVNVVIVAESRLSESKVQLRQLYVLERLSRLIRKGPDQTP
jgi:hypothetical protein